MKLRIPVIVFLACDATVAILILVSRTLLLRDHKTEKEGIFKVSIWVLLIHPPLFIAK